MIEKLEVLRIIRWPRWCKTDQMIEPFNSNSHRKPPSLSLLVEGKDNGLEDDFDFGVEGVAMHEESDDDIVLPLLTREQSN